jgi:hypothetical protein
VVIVGWDRNDEIEIENRYIAFEKKYVDRKSDGEIKSSTLSIKQFANGIASLNKNNIRFLSDFLDVFNGKLLFYFSSISKIEYLIHQLFRDYHNDIFVDIDAMKYTIIKSILTYRPEKIVNGIFENNAELVTLLKEFYQNRITANKANPKLKERETESFSQALLLLGSVKEPISIEWNYSIALDGFTRYIHEKAITGYELAIDREG